MSKIALLCTALFISFFVARAQHKPGILRADVNSNNITDIFTPTAQALDMDIDHTKYSLTFDALGFENLTDLGFANNTLTIGGFMNGSAAYWCGYKFRNNKKSNKIELIGFDCSYKSSATGGVSKSYNALTGRYEVLVREPDNHGKMTDKKYTGKAAIKKIVLITFKSSDWDKLNAIGSPY